jgi:2-dehydro-3-deoxyphosphooctonate aldolase (KDO 8-P synthase)
MERVRVARQIVVGDDRVGRVTIGENCPLVLIGGPCAIESEDHSLFMADELRQICARLNVPFIFKSCYDKDCRSSTDSFHGLGLEDGLEILAKVREEVGVPVTTDFSDAAWASSTGQVADLVQVPAYLCRQTHLLLAAGQTGKPINIKKGQFMSPWNMRNSVEKIVKRTGNDQIMVTERGTFFGYNMLVNDFRSLPIMKETGCPVCYDATHSVQLPTSLGSLSGGQREYIPSLVRAAAASGIHALFMEIHDDPDNALSDPATQLNIKYVEKILVQAQAIHEARAELIAKLGEDDVH